MQSAARGDSSNCSISGRGPQQQCPQHIAPTRAWRFAHAQCHEQHRCHAHAAHTGPEPPAASTSWHKQRKAGRQQAVSLLAEPVQATEQMACNARASTHAGPCPPPGLSLEQLPVHVAIIMDGNKRWAKARGGDVRAGHKAGVQALQRAVKCCQRWGIRALTVYAFSNENWQRSNTEVEFLLNLFQVSLEKHLAELMEEGVRLRCVGNLDRLPMALQTRMRRCEEVTAGNTKMTLTVALSYSGRQDITQAARSIARLVASRQLQPEQVTEELLESHLSTAPLLAEVGQPDLLIRTSGEQRLSNFLCWEAAYTELHWCDVLWPLFDEHHFAQALYAYASRERRFGKH